MSGPSGLVRVGVIGAGYWSVTNHLPVLARRPEVQLASICDPGPNLSRIAQEYDFDVVTTDLDEALSADLDAVVIASPNQTHHTIGMAAFERGLHAMIEKPLAVTPEDAWSLVRGADQANRIGLVPYGWNYAGFIRAARASVRSGEIGEVESFTCHMASPTVALFDGEGSYGPVPAGGVAVPPAAATWSSVDHGGGYALGQLTHALGLLFWLSGRTPADVQARTRPSRTGVDVVVAAVATLDNGAVGCLSGSGHLPDHAPYEVGVTLIGTHGSLVVDIAAQRCELRTRAGRTRRFAIDPGERVYNGQPPVDRFVDLVTGSSMVNESPLRCGAHAVAAATALIRSARSQSVERCTTEES